MNPSLFALLEQVLRPHESLHFTISRQPNGLVLLLQPVLGKKNEDVPKEAEQTRAVLAMPLRLSGSAADLDAAFVTKLQGYGQARHELHDSYQMLLDALREANKDANSKTQQTGKSAVTKPKGAPASATTSAASAAAPAPAPANPSPPTENSASAAPPAAPPVTTARSDMMQPMSLL